MAVCRACAAAGDVPETSAPWTAAFRKGLSEAGYDEGRNVTIEYRWAHNDPARLPELAADLVRRRVAVIVAPGTVAAVRAAKAATSTIPIVFRTGGDPVALGLVPSLNQPGGNITGINAMSLETSTKRLGLLHELLPRAARFAVLVNLNDPNADYYTKDLKAAASTIERQVEFIGAGNNRESTLHLPAWRKGGPMGSWSCPKVCSPTAAHKS